MATFPIAKNPTISTFSEETESVVLRTSMEGVTKQALRYSKQYRRLNLMYILTDAELTTFETFFTTTITRGVDSFDWTDPLRSDAVRDATIVNGEVATIQEAPNVNKVSFVLEYLI